MKIWKVKIETADTFFLKRCPSGGELCEILGRQTKLANPFLSQLRNSLKEKGWEDRKLASLITVDLGSDGGVISIYCTPVEVLE